MNIFEYIFYGLIGICLLIMVIIALAGIRFVLIYLIQLKKENKKEGKK